MPIIDILIAVALTISIVIGLVRGFVKEAISITALLLAIWAALSFGASVGEISDSWISSKEMQTWFRAGAGIRGHPGAGWPARLGNFKTGAAVRAQWR